MSNLPNEEQFWQLQLRAQTTHKQLIEIEVDVMHFVGNDSLGSTRGVQMSISYRSNRDPDRLGGNAYFVSGANLLY